MAMPGSDHVSTRPGSKRKASRRSRQSPARAAQLPSRRWLSPFEQLAYWRLFATHPTWLWPYGALAAILAVVVWPAWSNPGKLMVGGDVLVYFYPLQVLLRDSLAAGELPFW